MRIISENENFDFPIVIWVVSCLIVVLRSGAAAAAASRAVLYCTVLYCTVLYC